jgi:hypothetical protein
MQTVTLVLVLVLMLVPLAMPVLWLVLRSSHRKHVRALRQQVQEAVLESGSLDMRRGFDVSQLLSTAYSFLPLCVRAVPSAPSGTLFTTLTRCHPLSRCCHCHCSSPKPCLVRSLTLPCQSSQVFCIEPLFALTLALT